MSNTGGPAFPVPDIDGSAVAEGMTLRDYFAGQAMNRMIERAVMHFNETGHGNDWEDFHEYIGEQSYLIADAMLKARQA